MLLLLYVTIIILTDTLAEEFKDLYIVNDKKTVMLNNRILNLSVVLHELKDLKTKVNRLIEDKEDMLVTYLRIRYKLAQTDYSEITLCIKTITKNFEQSLAKTPTDLHTELQCLYKEKTAVCQNLRTTYKRIRNLKRRLRQHLKSL